MTDIWLVVGMSSSADDTTYWSVSAYTEVKYAEKARLFLQKLSNRLDQNDESSAEFRRDYEELKLHDSKAFYNGMIMYFVEPLKLVV